MHTKSLLLLSTASLAFAAPALVRRVEPGPIERTEANFYRRLQDGIADLSKAVQVCFRLTLPDLDTAPRTPSIVELIDCQTHPVQTTQSQSASVADAYGLTGKTKTLSAGDGAVSSNAGTRQSTSYGAATGSGASAAGASGAGASGAGGPGASPGLQGTGQRVAPFSAIGASNNGDNGSGAAANGPSTTFISGADQADVENQPASTGSGPFSTPSTTFISGVDQPQGGDQSTGGDASGPNTGTTDAATQATSSSSDANSSTTSGNGAGTGNNDGSADTASTSSPAGAPASVPLSIAKPASADTTSGTMQGSAAANPSPDSMTTTDSTSHPAIAPASVPLSIVKPASPDTKSGSTNGSANGTPTSDSTTSKGNVKGTSSTKPANNASSSHATDNTGAQTSNSTKGGAVENPNTPAGPSKNTVTPTSSTSNQEQGGSTGVKGGSTSIGQAADGMPLLDAAASVHALHGSNDGNSAAAPVGAASSRPVDTVSSTVASTHGRVKGHDASTGSTRPSVSASDVRGGASEKLNSANPSVSPVDGKIVDVKVGVTKYPGPSEAQAQSTGAKDESAKVASVPNRVPPAPKVTGKTTTPVSSTVNTAASHAQKNASAGSDRVGDVTSSAGLPNPATQATDSLIRIKVDASVSKDKDSSGALPIESVTGAL